MASAPAVQREHDDLPSGAPFQERRESAAARGTPITTENPYLAARREWNERYGDLITRAQNWRTLAFVCATASVVLAIGMIAMATRSRVVPYIIAVDNIGRVVNTAPAENPTRPDEKLLRVAVADWVQAMRMVTSDPQAELRAIDRVYAMIGKGSAAQTFITEYYRANSPLERAATVTVNVDVRSVVASSENSFEVAWTETTRDLTGGIKGAETYQGSFTIVVNPPSDERTIRLNPLGVYITHVSWSKVL